MIDFIFFSYLFDQYHGDIHILLFNKEKWKFPITVKGKYINCTRSVHACISKISYVGHLLIHQHRTLLHDIFLEFRHFEYIC